MTKQAWVSWFLNGEITPVNLTEGDGMEKEARPVVSLAGQLGRPTHNSDVSGLNVMSGSTGRLRNHWVNWLTIRPAAMLAQ